MTARFSGKVVLVTGGASGIGRATALAFGLEGAKVWLADLDAQRGDKTAREITQAGGQARFVHTDVSRKVEVAELIQAIVADHGRLDCAFNNAGVEGSQLRTADVSEAEWDRIMSVNLKGVWLCLKHELGQMIAQGGGAIVNNASIFGLVGAHSLPVYSASKHGVIGLTRSAALEYARKSIRVNAVCPALIRTPMADRATGAALPAAAYRLVDQNPTRRLGEPAEVAAAVLWLCSEEASFVNGTALRVDGGFVAQ